jgi:hypothetical protein
VSGDVRGDGLLDPSELEIEAVVTAPEDGSETAHREIQRGMLPRGPDGDYAIEFPCSTLLRVRARRSDRAELQVHPTEVDVHQEMAPVHFRISEFPDWVLQPVDPEGRPIHNSSYLPANHGSESAAPIPAGGLRVDPSVGAAHGVIRAPGFLDKSWHPSSADSVAELSDLALVFRPVLQPGTASLIIAEASLRERIGWVHCEPEAGEAMRCAESGIGWSCECPAGRNVFLSSAPGTVAFVRTLTAHPLMLDSLPAWSRACVDLTDAGFFGGSIVRIAPPHLSRFDAVAAAGGALTDDARFCAAVPSGEVVEIHARDDSHAARWAVRVGQEAVLALSLDD